ncbi:MAG: hypothetical protein V4850_10680 [Myxococcota bacterium]
MILIALLSACTGADCPNTDAERTEFARQYGTQLYDYYVTCLEPGTYAPDTLEGVVAFVEQRAMLLERCGGAYDRCAAALCLEELATRSDCQVPVICELDGTLFTPACEHQDTAR